MSAVPMRKLDLMTPPVVKTIQQRSLLIGLVFGAIAAVGAWLQPDQFFRAYLMAFMAWLGVTLGSMAILMLRHLTKGAWGMVIRRILGAAMRCVPLMAALFIPLLFGIRRLYIWARPLDAHRGQASARTPAGTHAKLSLSEWIYHPRRDLLRHLVGAFVLSDQVVGGAGPPAHARQQRDASRRSAGRG